MPPQVKAPTSFLYMAAKARGGRAIGVRRARDRRQLADQLRRERLVPLRSWQLPAWASIDRAKMTMKDQAELHTQLAQLLSRGVPLVEALEVTAGAVTPANKPLVLRMKDMVASGAAFSEACHTLGAFDRVTVAVYKAAERSGDLAGAARQLSHNVRRQLAMSGKAVTLMLYPAIVLSISTVVTLFVITIIVPRIGEAIESAGAELPLYTKVMMRLGVLLRDNFIAFLLLVLGVLTAAVFGRRALGVIVSRLLRKTPLLREVLLAQESARFFTVMAAMTKSGVVLADALGVATGAIGHPTLKKQLQTLQIKLIEGGLLRVLIDNVTALPMPTRRLLIAAERSGDLQSAFETLASDMAEEVDRKSSRLLAVLEPGLIVMMFLVIGSLLLSIMIPLMNLSAAVR